MSIRLIASDCDGTLLDDDKKIDAGMSEVLPLLRKQGIEFTLATGRNMEIVMPFVKALDLRVPIITNGGAEIDVYKRQQLLGYFMHFTPADQSQKL